MSEAPLYRGYSKLRTRTALGSYGRAMPRGIGSPVGAVRILYFEKPLHSYRQTVARL